jgi:hypothetical protein
MKFKFILSCLLPIGILIFVVILKGVEKANVVDGVPLPIDFVAEDFSSIDWDGELTEWVEGLKTISPSGCPTIFSSWHVKRLEVDGDSDFRNGAAGRDFGKKILEKFDRLTGKLVGGGFSQSSLVTQAECLIDLSNWLRKGQSNGNIVISTRSRGLACIAICFLSVDLSFPIEEVEALVSDVAAYDEEMVIRDYVIAIDRETNGKFALLVAKGRDLDETKMNFDEARYKIRKSSDIKDEDLYPKARMSEDRLIASQLDGSGVRGSTTELWESWYRAAPSMLHTNLLESLNLTLVFRKRVGGFPLRPLPKDIYKDGKLSPFYQNEVDAAFCLAWDDSFRGVNNEDLPDFEEIINCGAYAYAAMIYNAVKEKDNQFKYFLGKDRPLSK